MSETVGGTDPDDDLIGEDEHNAFDDELDALDRAYASSGWSTTLTSPMALGIAALVLSSVSLIGLLSTYLVANSIAAAHPTEGAVFDLRVSALVELGLALLGVLFAVLAHGGARIDPDVPAHRAARWMAGAALLLAIVSILESGGSLLVLLGAHALSVSGG